MRFALLTGIRIILPLLLAALVMACSSSVAQPTAPPSATAVPEASPTPKVDETTRSGVSGSYADFQCSAETPSPFANAEWTEYQPLLWTSIKLPSDHWESRYEDSGFTVYFLPAADATGNQWSAALTFYVYYEDFIREDLGLSWDGFVQANLDAIADDGDSVPNFRLVRQWEVQPKPLPRSLSASRYGPPPIIRDNRAEFRYGDDKSVDGYGMSKRIGELVYFIRLDVCAYNRSPERETIVEKMFDSLSSGYGGYW